MLVFRYNVLSVLLFVVILNCETAFSLRGGADGAFDRIPFISQRLMVERWMYERKKSL